MTTQNVHGDSQHAHVSRRELEARVARTKTSGLVGVGGVPLPLKWKTHHVKVNGWYGVTATGYEACYVYQPWDNHIRRGPMPWQVFSYFGGKDHPLTGTARFGKFPNASSAKRAAQKWWRGKMLAMLSGGGGRDVEMRPRRQNVQHQRPPEKGDAS